MQCNIDARGKRARLLTGLGLTTAAAGVLALRLAGVLDGPWWWWVVAALGSMGVTAILGGWAGWCGLRAMGIKTPL